MESPGNDIGLFSDGVIVEIFYEHHFFMESYVLLRNVIPLVILNVEVLR